jgi:hypothetical protein
LVESATFTEESVFGSVFLLSQTLEEEQGADMLRQRDEQIEKYLSLQTKYRDLQAQFANLRNRYLLIECAWCQRRIGWKRKTTAVPGETSHGICPSCATTLFRKMQAMKDFQARSSRPTPQSAV